MTGPIRVVVAHSIDLIGHAVVQLLRAVPHIVLIGRVAARDVPRGIDPSASPDVILVECLSETAACSNLLRCLKEVFPSARALILCRDDLDADSRADLVAAGVSDFLKPDCSPGQLISEIKRVSQAAELCTTSHVTWSSEQQPSPASAPGSTLASDDREAAMDQRDVAPVSGIDLQVSLAPREREVLETLATGLSTEEVAVRLGITVHTVRTHLRNVLTKLDAHSKLEAVVKAMRSGLIDLRGPSS